MIGRTFRALLAALLVSGLALPGFAAEVSGVAFSERISPGDVELPLRGSGLFRYKRILKGYAAGLYLAPGVPSELVLEDVPRRLEIHYFWSIPAHAFARATVQGIERNVSPQQLEELRDRIARFNALYRNVEPGDRYALTYLPGGGTELSLNGQPLGRVEGSDFSAAVFAIWLGAEPFDDGLKQQLLGAR